MKYLLLYSSIALLAFFSCSQISPKQVQEKQSLTDTITPNTIGNTIETRFPTPKGYSRLETNNQYHQYLRNLPLKKEGSPVLYYNGAQKPNYNVYVGVVDLPIGKKNLHQCADAVMRVRAQHLWESGEYGKIHFNYTNGFKVPYSKWRLGYRVKVSGNKCTWVKTASPSDSYATFWKYMEAIFNYAGTMSLSKELIPTPRDSMQIGDVFIQGGFPGHAIVVVDMAIDSSTNNKIFMLAQSYMPAQELQVLLNPNDENKSPWYDLDFGNTLKTPEWDFTSANLKRFEQ